MILQGDSYEHAMAMIHEAVELTLADMSPEEITIPDHDGTDLKTGTILGILRQAKVSAADFLAVL